MKKIYIIQEFADCRECEEGCNAYALDGYVLYSFQFIPSTTRVLAVFRLDPANVSVQQLFEENRKVEGP